MDGDDAAAAAAAANAAGEQAPAPAADPGSPAPERNLPRQQEQVLRAELQPHLAAAEGRVFKSLHQIVESVEARLLGALRQATVSIIGNVGKEAAACLFLSERKAATLGNELNYTRQQAVSMLMRLKQTTDAQISDAARQILFERGRAQEAEVKLSSAQESNRRLRLELKRKGQVLEALQRCYPQGLQRGCSGGPEGRKGGSRLKGSAAGPRQPPQTAGQPTAAISESVKVVPGAQMGAVGAQPVVNGSMHDTHAATRIHPAFPTIDFHQPGRIDFKTREDAALTSNGPTATGSHGQHRPPMRDFASGEGAESTISRAAHQVRSLAENCQQYGSSSTLGEKEEVALFQKSDPEFRSLKDSDEEKSCLTIEALYCKDEAIPTCVQPVEEYQSDVNHRKGELQESDIPKCPISIDHNSAHETDVPVEADRECGRPVEAVSSSKTNDTDGPTEQCPFVTKEVEKAQERTGGTDLVSPEFESSGHPAESVTKTTPLEPATTSPLAKSPSRNAPPEVPPAIEPAAEHCPGEQACTPEPKSGPVGGQVLRRKRKQGSSKRDGIATGKRSKRLDEEDALTGICGLDSPISSRDSRRLMQGARQLFQLAERKWR